MSNETLSLHAACEKLCEDVMKIDNPHYAAFEVIFFHQLLEQGETPAMALAMARNDASIKAVLDSAP